MQDIVSAVLQSMENSGFVQVEVSARHVHLSSSDVVKLFGEGAKLTPVRDLSQPGQFLCEERVTLIGPKGKFSNTAVLGPARSHTQIELSRGDTFALGISAPIRDSGDIAGSGEITIEGTKGKITVSEGAIIAKRHIHVPAAFANKHGLKDQSIVNVEIFTDRPVILKDVLLRVSENYSYRMHIDIDEANAANVSGFTLGRIIK